MTDRHLPALHLLLAAAAIALLGCDADVESPSGCVDLELRLSLDSANLPVPPDVGDNKKCDWDVFAWNSFAALNWPVNPDQRGIASASKTFLGNKDHGAEAVWESFKEKGEVFQKTPTSDWNDEEISFEKVDLWDQYGGYCSAEDQEQGPKAASGPFALDKFHNRLDETAEVQSEAREGSSVLCQGYADPPSQGCNIEGQVVGPRVWKGKPALAGGAPNPAAKPVYYEVKVNYDFFDYVMNPPSPVAGGALYDDEVAAFNAIQGRIQLPFRTAAAKGGSSTVKSVHSYEQPGHECNATVGKDGFPCRVGAVHMKSAWISMEGEDADKFHTTTAIYYKSVDTPDGPVVKCAAVGKFGLIGLHAIQRVHSTSGAPDYTQQTTGGAFVFATWEHRSVIPESGSSDYTYVNYRVATSQGDFIEQPYPQLEYAIPVTRLVPFLDGGETTCGLSQQQTCDVNEAARKNLGDSVWANYHLIGTQFAPVNCQYVELEVPPGEEEVIPPVAQPVPPNSSPPDPTTCRQISTDHFAQPYFLANAVIETNLGLQQFSGQAKAQPRFTPPQWCEKTTGQSPDHCLNDGTRKVPSADPGDGFERNYANVTFGGNPINMGGCQGCHGVAQQNGYSFSFVLLDGQLGAGADTEQDAVIPATNLDQTIELYIESIGTPNTYLSSDPSDRKKIALVDKSSADTWRLVPYYRDRDTGTFPGDFFVYNATQKQWLTTGKPASHGGIGDATSTTETMMLADLLDGGSTSLGSTQQFFEVVGFANAGTGIKQRAVAFNAVLVGGLINAPATGNATATATQPDTAQQDDQGFLLSPATQVEVAE